MEYAIGIGGNLGDRAATQREAARQLSADGMVEVLVRSPAIETAAVGGPPGQPPHLNAAWIVRTDLGPHQLLARLQAVEAALGRTRSIAGGARTIDLDLLLSRDGSVISNPVLVLPHPRLHQRAFVLEPLAAIAGDWPHPVFAATVGELWRRFQQGLPPE